jgi:hypothetical protein
MRDALNMADGNAKRLAAQRPAVRVVTVLLIADRAFRSGAT